MTACCLLVAPLRSSPSACPVPPSLLLRTHRDLCGSSVYDRKNSQTPSSFLFTLAPAAATTMVLLRRTLALSCSGPGHMDPSAAVARPVPVSADAGVYVLVLCVCWSIREGRGARTCFAHATHEALAMAMRARGRRASTHPVYQSHPWTTPSPAVTATSDTHVGRA